LKYARQLIISLCSSHNSPTLPQKNRISNVKDHCFYAARDFPINDVYRRAHWISLPFDFCLSPKVSEKISRQAVCACLSFSKMDVYLYTVVLVTSISFSSLTSTSTSLSRVIRHA
jgi:hypothetical protein